MRAMFFSTNEKDSLMKWCNAIILLILLTVSGCTAASPTENEFERCEILAVSTLEYCIKKVSPGYDNNHCWMESKAGYNECRKGVIYGHNRTKKNREGRQKKRLQGRCKKKFSPFTPCHMGLMAL